MKKLTLNGRDLTLKSKHAQFKNGHKLEFKMPFTGSEETLAKLNKIYNTDQSGDTYTFTVDMLGYINMAQGKYAINSYTDENGNTSWYVNYIELCKVKGLNDEDLKTTRQRFIICQSEKEAKTIMWDIIGCRFIAMEAAKAGKKYYTDLPTVSEYRRGLPAEMQSDLLEHINAQRNI